MSAKADMPIGVEMDEGATNVAAVSDGDLLAEVRSGDADAYGVLWQRHYDSGVRAAHKITSRFDPDDLAQEAFARILTTIRGGNGPRDAFRPYLYATIRSISMNWTRDGRDSDAYELADDRRPDPDAAFEDDALERTVTGSAYSALRSEWRSILWYTEVEGMAPREAAPFLGVTSNAAAALAYRAREGLRAAWLQAHVKSDSASPECVATVQRLGAYAQGRLTRRDRDAVQEHLTVCLKCAILVEELEDMASNLRLVLLPLIFGSAATGFAAVPLDDGSASRVLIRSDAEVDARSQSPHAGSGVVSLVATAVLVIALAAAGYAATQLGTQLLKDTAGDGAPSLAHGEPVGATVEPPADVARLETDGSVGSGAVPETFVEMLPRAEVVDPSGSHPGAERPDRGESPTRDSAAGVPAVTPSEPAAIVVPPGPEPGPEPSGPPGPEPVVVVSTPVVEGYVGGDAYLPELYGVSEPGREIVLLLVGSGVEVGRVVAAPNGEWSLRAVIGPDVDAATVVAVAIEDGVRSEPSAPWGPFTFVRPAIGLVEDGVAQPRIEISGEPGMLVEVLINGVGTGNLHRLEGAPLERVMAAGTPVGSYLLSARYVDSERALVGQSTVPLTATVAP